LLRKLWIINPTTVRPLMLNNNKIGIMKKVFTLYLDESGNNLIYEPEQLLNA